MMVRKKIGGTSSRQRKRIRRLHAGKSDLGLGSRGRAARQIRARAR